MFLNKAGLDIRISSTGERYSYSKRWPSHPLFQPVTINSEISLLLQMSEIGDNNQRLNRRCLAWNEKRFKAGGVGCSRKPRDQTNTLFPTPSSYIRAIVKHVLHERPLCLGLKYNLHKLILSIV
jgi:hypothetical protein